MAVILNRKIEYRGFRFLLCILFTMIVLSLISVVGYAEDGIQALNSSGNQNIKLSVDPINKSEGFSAVLYDNRNGMLSSEANAIAQTGDGFIWIGSYAGLIRYDGNTFERLSSAAEILNVRCMFVDSRDRLWIGSNDCGVFYMSEGRFHKLESSGQLASVSIRSLAEDAEGVIYIGSAAGLSMVDSDLNLTALEDVRLVGQTIREIRLGADGLIYGLTSAGDLFSVKNGEVLTFLDHAECRVEDVLCILPDPVNAGCLYLGTGGSQVFYGSLEDNFSDLNIMEITPLLSVECLEYIDGQIWIGAGNGIGKLNNEEFFQLKNIPMENTVGHVMTDYEGNLWFTSTRQCVMKIVPNQFLDVFLQYNLPPETVNTVCMLGQKLFLGMDSGLLVIEEGKKLSSIPVTKAVTASGTELQIPDLLKYLDGIRIRSLIRDSRERLWICTWRQRGLICYDHGEVTVFTEADGLLSDRIRTVSECEDGSVIVAYVGGACVIQDNRVTASFGEKDGIVATDILSVTEGFNHEVIVGSDGSGIYVFSPDGNRHIGRENGLNSEIILRIKRSLYQDIYWIITGNSIAYMTPDFRVTTVEHFPFTNNYDLYESSSGNIWVLSSNGIYVVSAKEMLANGKINAVLYGMTSGLPYLPISNSYSELAPDGDLYIAGMMGCFRANIEKPFEDVRNVKIALPYIDADGVRYYPNESGEFSLPGNTKRVTIYPYVLNFSLFDPEVTYFLDGFELNETTVARSRLLPADYTNLKLGNYRFVMTVQDPLGHSFHVETFRIAKGRKMPVGDTGTVIMDAAALLLLGGILVGTSQYRRRGRMEDKLFFSMTLSNIAMAVGELLSYTLENTTFPFIRETMILGNTVFYISLVLFPYFLLLYLDYSLHPDTDRIRKMKLLFGIPCFLFIIVMIINLKTGWIFSIREGNVFHAGKNRWLNFLPVIPVWFYFLFSFFKMAKLNLRLAILGMLLILARLSWEFLYQWISSTSFMYALLLACTHIHVMNRPAMEGKP